MGKVQSEFLLSLSNILLYGFLWYNTYMSTQAIQVSMDKELLKRIDRDPEVKERGRSAFIRSAVELYLRAKERREIDAAIERAYEGCADGMLDEATELVEAQEWPAE